MVEKYFDKEDDASLFDKIDMEKLAFLNNHKRKYLLQLICHIVCVVTIRSEYREFRRVFNSLVCDDDFSFKDYPVTVEEFEKHSNEMVLALKCGA